MYVSQYGWVNPEVGQLVKVVTEKANFHKNFCPSLFEHITIKLYILCQPVQGACACDRSTSRGWMKVGVMYRHINNNVKLAESAKFFVYSAVSLNRVSATYSVTVNGVEIYPLIYFHRISTALTWSS